MTQIQVSDWMHSIQLETAIRHVYLLALVCSWSWINNLMRMLLGHAATDGRQGVAPEKKDVLESIECIHLQPVLYSCYKRHATLFGLICKCLFSTSEIAALYIPAR